MACPAILTGHSFLGETLSHIDCQAQTIGAYGYGALADPGSSTSLALTALLTVFVAIFGIRLLFGHPLTGHDLIGDLIKVAIALTLATSWPAWRVLGYDLVVDGPGQIARAIGLRAQLPGASGDLIQHLQRIDEALAALNVLGSGRLGAATGDWFQLGFARSAFLLGTIAPLALVRLAAGILLAIAPLFAGLLLFGITRAVFDGWVRGLVMTFIASMALTLILGTEVDILEPWLQDALAQRASDTQILDAPIEIAVMTPAFALISFGMIAIAARIAFHASTWMPGFRSFHAFEGQRGATDQLRHIARERGNLTVLSRASTVAHAVSENMRREERLLQSSGSAGTVPQARAPNSVTLAKRSDQAPSVETLGSSYRRGARRISSSSTRRDQVR